MNSQTNNNNSLIIKKETFITKLKNWFSTKFNQKSNKKDTTNTPVPSVSEERRIVICGEPHSGKSVLYRTLYKALPQQYMISLSACPDSESIFSGNSNQEIIQASRIKGKFTPQFIKNTKQEIDNIDTSILLCDIGGKISKENKEICSRCNTAIILYRTPEILEQWRKFCQETGLQIIAEIESKLDITKNESEILPESKDGIIRGLIYNLKRGQEALKVNDGLIKKLCDEICRPLQEKGNLRRTGRHVLKSKNTLDMKLVAQYLNLIDENNNINWNPSDAKRISDIVKGFAYSKSEITFYDARATWLSALVVDSAVKQGVEDISLYDMRLNAPIKTKKLEQTDLLAKESTSNFDKYELVKDKVYLYVKQSDTECVINFITNPPDFRIPVDYLEHIKLPVIDESKELYIMGKIPLWLLNSVSRSYSNTEKYCCQMGKEEQFFTKFSSSNIDSLGTIKSDADTIESKKFLRIITEDMKAMIAMKIKECKLNEK